MWILILVLYTNQGVRSEQIESPYSSRELCNRVGDNTIREYRDRFKYPKMTYVCVEKNQ